MKLSIYLLGLASAMCVAFFTSATEGNLEERVKLLEVAEPGQLTGALEKPRSQLSIATRSQQYPWEKNPFASTEFLGSDLEPIPRFLATPGSVAVKYAYTAGKFRQPAEMNDFVDHAMSLISTPSNPVDRSSFRKALEKGAAILSKVETSLVNRFRTLGFITELLRAAPWKPKDGRVLINKWPDRLKLELEATQEYAEAMAHYLLIKAYSYDTKEDLDWSDMDECFVRARLIGTYQNRLENEAPGKSQKNINDIISTHFIKAHLPRAERDIERLILEMRRNLREISSNTWEGEYSIDILAHLFKYQSAVQSRLFELEKHKDFWKDINLPQARASLEALSNAEHGSEVLRQEIARVMKLESEPSYENLKSVLENMKVAIESENYSFGLQIYKLMQIGSLYSSEFEERIYKLLFSDAHVPHYLAKLWSHIHPQLVVNKDIRFYPYKIMIKDNPHYFCDAKRHILSLKMSKFSDASFSELRETLDSLTVNPHENIQEESIERICQQVLNCLQSKTIGEELSKPNAIAITIETILRVLEYEPKSIGYLLEYMDHNQSFRNILYRSVKEFILIGQEEKNSRLHLEKPEVPQLLGFMKQIIMAHEDIWSIKFPNIRLNTNFGLEDEKSEEKFEKIQRAKEALEREITESKLF